MIEKCERARKIHISICWFLTLGFAVLAASFILLALYKDSIDPVVIYLAVMGFIFSLVFAIVYSICVKFKVYNFENNEIKVYAGPCNLFLFYNDKLVDEFRSFSRFVPVELTYNGEINISCIISNTNGIRMKINEQLVTPIN